MTININLTEVFIYTLVFVTLTSIIYYIITFDESKFYKKVFRGVDITISSIISFAVMFISYNVYNLLCNIHFTFKF
jgi:multisubunit Na+/H+ antiporter MnhB subunit